MNIKYIIQSNINKESVQQALAIAKQIIHSMRGQNGTKIISIDSTTAIIKVYEDSASVLIPTEDSGFVFHPRSSMYPNGINTSTGEKIATTYPPFPLYDDDKGTMLLEDVSDLQLDIPDGDNYGIHIWTSDDGENISWKGWPAITIGCDRLTFIPGVSHIHTQGLDVTYYTPLTGNIYNGDESVTALGIVKGACVSIYGLVAVVTKNYTVYDMVGFGTPIVNPIGEDWMYDNNVEDIPKDELPGKVGNYFDELHVYVGNSYKYNVSGRIRSPVDGWLRIGYHVSAIDNLPVWFSANGLSAVEDAGEWSWSLLRYEHAEPTSPQAAFSYNFVPRTDVHSPHQYTVTGFDPYITPGSTVRWSVVSNTVWDIMYMHTKHGSVSYSIDDRTDFKMKKIESYTSASVIYQKTRPDPTAQYIEWNYPETYLNNIYTISFSAVQFKAGPYTWAGAAVNPDQSALASVTGEIKCVPYGTPAEVKVVSVTDNCGFSASTSYEVPVRYGNLHLISSGSCHNVTFSGAYVSSTGWWHEFDGQTDMLYEVAYMTVTSSDWSWTCGEPAWWEPGWGGQVIGTDPGGSPILALRFEHRELSCDY